MLNFPQIIDYYIKMKEADGDEALSVSSDKVIATELIFIHQLTELQSKLLSENKFYNVGKTTYEETHARLAYLKDVIENTLNSQTKCNTVVEGISSCHLSGISLLYTHNQCA